MRQLYSIAACLCLVVSASVLQGQITVKDPYGYALVSAIGSVVFALASIAEAIADKKKAVEGDRNG